MLSSRKKRPLDRAAANRDAKLMIIAVEGQKTEEIYFKNFDNVKIKIKIINNVSGKSSPQHILDNMQNYIDSYEIGPEDELWLVIDRDAWSHGMLSRVASSCKQKNIKLAVSNPCFELWLAHHIDAPLPENIDCKILDSYLKTNLGSYNKSKYDAKLLINNVDKAITDAEAFDKNKKTRWPQPIGTRVYQIIKTIQSL